MISPLDNLSVASRSELGGFLKSRRERLTPGAVGLGDRQRRRTPGLRREEVAERAGIGIDWYIRLEQGRAVTPSKTTIDALARALLLSKVEHAHLRTLAAHPERSVFSRETVPDPMRRMVESLHHPAYITGRRWDVLAWNAAASEVFTDFSQAPVQDRNILLYMLTTQAAKHLFGQTWADEARRMMALFRTTHDVWAGDPAFVELLDRLREGCPEFQNWWNTHDVGFGSGVTKLLHHPTRGLLRFEAATFQANDDRSLRLAIYTPLL